MLHQDGGYRALALVQFGLYNDSLRTDGGIRFQLLHLRHEQHHLEQLRNSVARLCRNIHHYSRAAPLFRSQSCIGQLLPYSVWFRRRFVDFVDGNNNRHTSRLGVVDGLSRLWHHSVVRSYNEDGDVRGLGASGSHRGESLMPRCIEEYDLFSLVSYNGGSNVLSYSPRFPCCDIGLSDEVKEGGLAVVDMSHNGYYRRAWLHVCASERLSLDYVTGVRFTLLPRVIAGEGQDYAVGIAEHAERALVHGSIRRYHHPGVYEALDGIRWGYLQQLRYSFDRRAF